ncbi:MAG: aldo/keto reductase, partial [Parafilimonas terrae]|nr:aldo/keto reductase [Parafilimonas terrae]
MSISRRAVVAAAALMPVAGRLARAAEPLIRRPIPSTGEMLPAIGIGTSRRYEVDPTPEKVAPLKEAVQTFVALGGTVIDTAPSYGTAEDVLGVILAETGLRQKIFLASKVDTTGRDQTRAEFERSLKRMKVDTLDLVAVHNLIDVADNLAVLRDLKGE